MISSLVSVWSDAGGEMFCFDKFNRKGAGEQVRDTVSSIKTDVRSRFLPMKHVRAADTTHISSLQRQRKSLTVVFCICVHRKQWKESRKETFTDWTNTCWHILHAVPRVGQDLLINRIFINSDNIWGILSSFLVFWLRHTGVSGHFTSISLFFLPRVSFSFPSLPSLHLPHRSPPPPPILLFFLSCHTQKEGCLPKVRLNLIPPLTPASPPLL